MPDNKDLIAKGGAIPEASCGLETKKRGRVSTTWKDIKWTRNKLVGTTIGLGAPYLVIIILTWMAEMFVITYILIGVAMLVGFIFLIVGWIDSDEF